MANPKKNVRKTFTDFSVARLLNNDDNWSGRKKETSGAEGNDYPLDLSLANTKKMKPSSSDTSKVLPFVLSFSTSFLAQNTDGQTTTTTAQQPKFQLASLVSPSSVDSNTSNSTASSSAQSTTTTTTATTSATVPAGAQAKKSVNIFRQCHICGTFVIDLPRHLRLHSYRPFMCPVCRHCFVEKWALDEHTRQRHSPDRVRCSFCPRYFANRQELEAHRVARHRFECAQCGSIFTAKSSMERHQDTLHSNVAKYTCKVCDMKFHYLHELIKHKKGVHSDRIPVGPKNESCAPGQGQKEHDSTSKAGSLSTAAPQHGKSFECLDCNGISFPTNEAFDEHVRTAHQTEKNYSCDLCRLKFADQTQLEKHRSRHETVSGFLCVLCGKEFATTAALLAHARRMHYDDL